jgi:nitroreductase
MLLMTNKVNNEEECNMDMVRFIKSRRSIRVFSQEMPSRAVIQECLEAAIWAPNPTNQQPWEFIVLSGEKLAQVNECIEQHFFERMQGSEYHNLPEGCEKRKDEIMEIISRVADSEGINPAQFFEKMLRFFDAPVAVLFLHYDAGEDTYKYGTSAALQNFLLASHARGLGCCWLGVVTVCQEDIKGLLGIPDDRVLLGGVAVGVPVKDSALNNFERPRVPVNELTTWYGL